MLVDDPYCGVFQEVHSSTTPNESAGVRSNGVYTAFPWNTGSGGLMKVMNAYDVESLIDQKFDPSGPFLRGHSAQVVDFEFSPFSNNLLATGAEDGHIKLWVLPEKITGDITKEDADL
jgi:coronin-1B/1C/6